MNTNQAWQDQTRNQAGEFGHRIHPEHDTFTPPDTGAGDDVADAPLSETELHARFAQPDAELTRKAVDDALGSYDFSTAALSWEKLMRRRPRTTMNQARYRDLKLAAIEADPALRDGFRTRVNNYVTLRQQKAAHAAAFEAGARTVYDKHFDDQWEGRTPGAGFSKADFEAHLTDAQKTLADVTSGRVKPSKVIGTGYRNPRKVAVDWLEASIAQATRDLVTHGRSNSVNIANAEYRHRHGVTASQE